MYFIKCLLQNSEGLQVITEHLTHETLPLSHGHRLNFSSMFAYSPFVIDATYSL